MKPSWDDAPEWARFVACDQDGSWHWFEFRPLIHDFEWIEQEGRRRPFKMPESKWHESLEERP